MPASPPTGNLLLWFSADQGVALDGSGRVISWDNRQSGLPSLSQANSDSRPILVSEVFNGYPGIQLSDGTFLGVESLGISGADFTLFVLGRTFSEQSPGSGPGASGRRFVFQQTLNRNIQGDSRPFLVAISVGSNGMALYELGLDDVPRAITTADMSVLCPLTVGYRESLPAVTLCRQLLAQPSVVTGYQIGMGAGGNNGFDGIVVELLLYQGTLSESDRSEAEAYLQEKYRCCDSSSSSSDSSSSESSDSSSSDSSSSEDSSSSCESSDSSSSDSSSSEDSSSSSESSDSSSSDSSSSEDSSSSSESSDSSSSSCSCVPPPDPTPVTDGLVARYRSDMNVTQDGDQVPVWGAVCDCLPDAVSIGVTPPLIAPGLFGAYPGITFDAQAGLQIQGGELADDSFTMFVIGRATGERADGGWGTGGQRLLFYQGGDGSNAWPGVSAGTQSIGVYEYGPGGDGPRANITTDAEVLCPLVIRYENRQLSVYLRGTLVYQDTSTPWYALHPAHWIGGTGDAGSGFIGTLAEIIFYNRALNDSERQQVEGYLQTRYGCMPSSSDSSEASDSSDSSSSDSSSSEDSSSSSSSDSSSSESSDSSESDSSEQSDESCDSSSSPMGKILRDEGFYNETWEPVEGQMAKALPGQVIHLRFEPVAGTTVTDYHWILPDTVFSDYTGEQAKGELKSRSDIAIDQQEVDFYWADSGAKVVKVQYKEDGVARETPVTIEVTKPTATLTATGGTSRIGHPIENSPTIDLYVHGLKFNGTVSIPAAFGAGGEWSFVQLATLDSWAKLDPTDDDPPAIKLDGGTYFDGGDYPYDGPFPVGTSKSTTDIPRVPLKAAYHLWAADLSFNMYIMFTPPGEGAKQVPLLRLPWSWSDAAVYYEDDLTVPWRKATEQRDPPVELGTAVDDAVHPHWSDFTDNHKEYN